MRSESLGTGTFGKVEKGGAGEIVSLILFLSRIKNILLVSWTKYSKEKLILSGWTKLNNGLKAS